MKLSLSWLLSTIKRFISRLTYHDQYVAALNLLKVKSAFEELGFVTAGLEHELHKPIATMDIQISLMRQQFHDDVEILDFLENLEEQLRRIQSSLAMIPLFEGDAEYFGHFMRKTDVRSLISRAIKNVKRGPKLAESITFRVDDRSLFIRAYPEMIEQALSCLLKNSVEAIREGQRERGLIEISVTRSVEKAALEVIDNGCGISEENLSRMREVFMSKDYGGIHWRGLFRVARILDVHDGELKIRSKLGKGTSVSVILPRWINR